MRCDHTFLLSPHRDAGWRSRLSPGPVAGYEVQLAVLTQLSESQFSTCSSVTWTVLIR